MTGLIRFPLLIPVSAFMPNHGGQKAWLMVPTHIRNHSDSGHMSFPIRSFLRTSAVAIWRALTYLWCSMHAASHGVFLLPPPLFWDKLKAINWELLQGNVENLPSPQFFATVDDYLRMRNMAHFSEAHLQLLQLFVARKHDASMPIRPTWLCF